MDLRPAIRCGGALAHVVVNVSSEVPGLDHRTGSVCSVQLEPSDA